ncbi:MAG: ribonuclease H family protein [Bacteroidales bacterium]|nr:ribonuclease H family protein [Bacteroidales bacterium]
MSKQKKKFYVVWKGREVGIFENWASCEKQIKGFTGAVYKAFPSREQAEAAFSGDSDDYLGPKAQRPELSPEDLKKYGKPILNSLSVDAACSGNPGIMEYRGVDTKSAIELFRSKRYDQGTVNIGEFLAIVHGLAYLKERNSNIPIYTDSKTALKWIKEKAIKTKLQKTPQNAVLFSLVDRAIKWLKSNEYHNKIIKWETAVWGEIPADFGRK